MRFESIVIVFLVCSSICGCLGNPKIDVNKTIDYPEAENESETDFCNETRNGEYHCSLLSMGDGRVLTYNRTENNSIICDIPPYKPKPSLNNSTWVLSNISNFEFNNTLFIGNLSFVEPLELEVYCDGLNKNRTVCFVVNNTKRCETCLEWYEKAMKG